MSYYNWDKGIAVGGRIAVGRGDQYYFGTVTGLGKPLGKFNIRKTPGHVKVEWDEGSPDHLPTKYNSNGQEWGTGSAMSYARYRWQLMSAENAKQAAANAVVEKDRNQRRHWLTDKLRISLVNNHHFDPAEKAAELRAIADMLEEEFVNGYPVSEQHLVEKKEA